MKKLVFASVIFLFFAPFVIGQSVNLPIDHWAYSFLTRMEAKGLFYSYELRSRPVPRRIFAELVLAIELNAAEHPQRLTKTEWKILEQLKSDLYDEIIQKKPTAKITKETHLFSILDDNGRVCFDLICQQAIISNRGHQYNPDQLLSETTLGGILRGHFGNTIGFYADARNSVTRGEDISEDDENFDPSKGSPVVVSGPNVIRDKASAYFVWEKPWIRLEGGRDEIDWGPGYYSVALTRNMPPADMFRLSSRFKMFKLSYTHAWLRSDLGPKYLAAHRLDVKIMQGFYAGASETVIYGNRDPELSYLNPLMLYQVAEHHLGDKDNNNISIDLTYTRIPKLTLYAEWFIDDMTSTKSWANYFGNKFAWTLGGLWCEPFSLKNMDMRIEYARIDPYVYTHWDSINIYTNYDKIIGHWLGPNSDGLFAQVGWQPGRDFRIELMAQHMRKGKGEADTQSWPSEGQQKDFLKGTVQVSNLFGIKIVDQLWRDCFVSISYNYKGTKNLNQRVGLNSHDHLARLELYFNY